MYERAPRNAVPFLTQQKYITMACKVTKSLNNKLCVYAVAGAAKDYIANWYPPVLVAAASEAPAPVAGFIQYVFDTDGYITDIVLPTGETFYEIGAADNTLSFSDALLVGGNGGKYRQQTVNAVLNQYDIDVLNEGDALSLGRFIHVVLDKAGKARVLGRTGGLSAPAGGFDYNSGAAEADATGWTIIHQGISTEIAPILKDLTAITVAPDPEVIP
jgi:hypothetical protein